MGNVVQVRILRALRSGPLYEGALALVVGCGDRGLYKALRELERKGSIERAVGEPWTWRLKGTERCPECDGYGKVRKTKNNAREPGPLGMLQDCGRCGGSGAVAA